MCIYIYMYVCMDLYIYIYIYMYILINRDNNLYTSGTPRVRPPAATFAPRRRAPIDVREAVQAYIFSLYIRQVSFFV